MYTDNCVSTQENSIVNLILNTDKTKELILDFRKNPPPLQPLIIKRTAVERANGHRFLGLQVT